MDNELDADDMSELIVLFKDHYKKSLGEDFPHDPEKAASGSGPRGIPFVG